MPMPVAAAAGFTGSVISNFLGFSYLTGTAVRYRFYVAFGLDLARMAGVIATSWVGFSLGLALIVGGCCFCIPITCPSNCLSDPPPLP